MLGTRPCTLRAHRSPPLPAAAWEGQGTKGSREVKRKGRKIWVCLEGLGKPVGCPRSRITGASKRPSPVPWGFPNSQDGCFLCPGQPGQAGRWT